MRHMKCSVGASSGFLNPNPFIIEMWENADFRCCSTAQEPLWFKFNDALIHPKHAEAWSVSKINNSEVSLPAEENHKKLYTTQTNKNSVTSSLNCSQCILFFSSSVTNDKTVKKHEVRHTHSGIIQKEKRPNYERWLA